MLVGRGQRGQLAQVFDLQPMGFNVKCFQCHTNVIATIVPPRLQLLLTHLYFMLVWRPMASFMWAWPCGAWRAPEPSLVLTEPWET